MRFVLVDDPGRGAQKKWNETDDKTKAKLARKGDKVCMEVFVPESNRRFNVEVDPRTGKLSMPGSQNDLVEILTFTRTRTWLCTMRSQIAFITSKAPERDSLRETPRASQVALLQITKRGISGRTAKPALPIEIRILDHLQSAGVVRCRWN